MTINLPDVQQKKDGFHNYYINKVGVRNIEIPISIVKKQQSGWKEKSIYFSTIATISSYCDLVKDVKGINMSRIARTIYDHFSKEGTELNISSIRLLSDSLQKNHNTENVFTKISFKYIFNSNAPKSDILTYEPVDVVFEDTLIDGLHRTYMTIDYTGMSLCPCSKEMSLLTNNLNEEEKRWLSVNGGNMPDDLYEKIINSGFGAHNQKSDVSVKVELNADTEDIMWIEDIVDILNNSYSCTVWSALKREDEKYVTEVSYMGRYIDEHGKFVTVDSNNGPKFVEDISRDIAHSLNDELDIGRIKDFCITVNNQESIHSNNILATAVLNAGLDLK